MRDEVVEETLSHIASVRIEPPNQELGLRAMACLGDVQLSTYSEMIKYPLSLTCLSEAVGSLT